MGESPSTRWGLRIGIAAFGAVALGSLSLVGAANAGIQQAGGLPDNVARSCAQATTPGQMACQALKRTDLREGKKIGPNATPDGYGPSDLLSAYSLPSDGGAGQTIAIVDAYDDPNAASDLATYRSTFGLPALASGQFTQVNENGQTSPLPQEDDGWAEEESLDVDMVSAIAPEANIVLVEADQPSDTDLYTAEDTAASLADYVSNSWGGAESSSQTSDDAHFNHPGVAITVSSGDEGYGAEYPATSQYVTAVGGTSLTGSGDSWSETVWDTSSTEGTGSGCSAYDTQPSWQANVSTGCDNRAEADVAAVADPETGVAVYDSNSDVGGWAVFGGTSASAPIIASVYALAGTPGSSDDPASYPYANPSALNDVTSGSNGSCSTSVLCTAGSGWDGPTGLGTPNGTAAFTSGG